jgi:hypothetical protein
VVEALPRPTSRRPTLAIAIYPCPEVVPALHPYLIRQPSGRWLLCWESRRSSFVLKEACTLAGRPGGTVLVDQTELACVTTTMIASARASAIRAAYTRERRAIPSN